MRPSVRRLEERYSSQVDFHLLNVDDPSTTALAQRYRVSGIPTIVLLHADGSTATILFGYQDERTLEEAIEALLAQ